jgi:FAD:protein FMN transferase
MKIKKITPAVIPALIIIAAFAVLFINNNNIDNAEKAQKNVTEPAYRSYPIMGTWAEISLYGDKKDTDKAFDIVQKTFNEVNNTCSRFKKDSELSELNRTAAAKPFKCDEMLWDVLLKSKFFYELSDGAFDVTITPLMELWGFFRKQNKIPSHAQIKNALDKVGLNKVVFNDEEHSIFFKNKDIEIDLGGIAKGYAVDLAYDAIKNLNIKAGVINLGGNIRTFPKPPPGRNYYSIGVRDPFDKDKIMNGTVKILGKSLATSGDYEQFVVINGERFTHIINPKTGYPIKDMAADTIISDSALWADGLSTSVFLNGEEFASKIHRKYPNIDILVIRGYKDTPASIKITKLGKVWEQIEEPLNEYIK